MWKFACGHKSVIWLAFALVAFSCASSASRADEPSRPRILFISSYHPGFPSFFPQIHGFIAGLEQAGYKRDNVALDIEYMDTKRFSMAAMEPRFHAALAFKLADLPRYDLVVVADDNAFDFALHNQESLFRGIPIVFLGVNDARKARAQDANPAVVGVVEQRSIGETLRLIEHLYPDSGQIHVVVDGTPTGIANRKQLEAEAGRLTRLELKFHLLGEMTYAELFDALSRLPSDAPLFVDASSCDREGRRLGYFGFLAKVKAAFKGPIFAVQGHGLGHGVLGGKIVSHEEQGRAAAMLAARILAGTPVSELRMIANSPNLYVFDHAELMRLGVEVSKLPEGARFVNRPPSVVGDYFAWVAVVVAFTAFQSTMIVLLLLNIGKRRRAERSLREATYKAEYANRAKSEFLSRMSHELRTPLNAIIGFSEVIKKELLGPVGVGRYRSYAEDIHSSGAHLLAIINDVLEMTKMSAGEVRLQEQTGDAKEILDRAVMQVELHARKRGVILVREPCPAPLLLRIDTRRITQVLLNLLSNAIKFTARGGTVRLGMTLGADGSVRLHVSDTGIGMSPEDLAEVVLPFRQVENAFSTSHEGTGLGVPIAIELARLHGGTLLYESALGKGTTATLVLPADRVVGRSDTRIAVQDRFAEGE